jgi:hypothetical protein
MKYGETEKEKLYSKKLQCREIVKEILDFGVDEIQKKHIIYLLSLELEDRNIMLEISKFINLEDNLKRELIL